MSDGHVHPGAFCSPAGAGGSTVKGTSMVCAVGATGTGRARWRRGEGDNGGAAVVALRSIELEDTVSANPAPRPEPAGAHQRPDDASLPSVQDAQQAIDDAQVMNPSARASMLASLAAGNERTGNTEVAQMYRQAAVLARAEADQVLAQGFVDNVHGRGEGASPVRDPDPATAYERAARQPVADVSDEDLDAAVRYEGAAGFRREVLMDEKVRRMYPPHPSATPVDGHRSTAPLAHNTWGVYGDGDGVGYHDDGVAGRAVRQMGEDQYMDVDGQPLANVVGRVATDVVHGRRSAQQAVDDMARLRDRLPAGSRGREAMDRMVAGMGAPPLPAPAVPASAPEPIARLVRDLHEQFPVVRRTGHETGRLVELLGKFDRGEDRVGGLSLIAGVRDAALNVRHESDGDRGKLQIDARVQQCVSELEQLRRTDRTALYPPSQRG